MKQKSGKFTVSGILITMSLAFNSASAQNNRESELEQAYIVWDLSYAMVNECLDNCKYYAKKYPKEYSTWFGKWQNKIALKNKARNECAVAQDVDKCVSIKLGN